MGLTAKNILINTVYYGLTVVLLPAIVLQIGLDAGYEPRRWWGLRVAAVIVAAAGVALQTWCIILFQRAARGTPSPLVPTQALVVTGPYRVLRNPLNLGELLVFLGLAAWFGSWPLLAYTVAAAFAFHLFIIRHEEPRNAAAFGEDYARYTQTVNRWIPNPHPQTRHRRGM